MKFCVLCAWRGHLAEREVEDRFSSSLQLKSGCPGKKQHAQAGRFTTKPAQRAHCTSNSACRTCHPVPWLGQTSHPNHTLQVQPVSVKIVWVAPFTQLQQGVQILLDDTRLAIIACLLLCSTHVPFRSRRAENHGSMYATGCR